MAPEVSVVMAVYNGERDLPHALESVLTQAGVDLEFIVVDDGSTDGSAGILRDRARHDARLRVVSKANEGLTHALILGCGLARAEFIARMDVDDLSLPSRFAAQAAALRADASLAMVACQTGCIGPQGELLGEIGGPSDPVAATESLLESHRGPTHGSVMFRKQAYDACGGYRKEFYFAQDADLWLRLGEVGRFQWLPDVGYLFRVSERSISSRWGGIQRRLGELAHECQSARRDGRPEGPFLEEARRLRPGLVPPGRTDPKGAAGLWFLSRCLLSRGDRRGLRYARKYIAARPADPRGWASLAVGYVTAWGAR